MPDALRHCQAIMKFGAAEEVDFHAEKQLKSSFYEYKQAKRVPLASSKYLVNEEEYDSLLQAFAEVKELETGGIRFFKPNMKENWDYNTPTSMILLMGDGMGIVERFDYDSFSLEKWSKGQEVQKELVMLRAFPTRFYVPMSIKTKSKDPLAGPPRLYIPRLLTLEEFWQDIRANGLVPFEIRVCAYTRSARFSYDIDLVNNRMLKDFRGGQVPPKNKAVRTAMDYMNFDMILASTDMKELVKKVFISLFEVKEATAFDISHTMGITDTMARNGLDAVVSRELADKTGKPPRETYKIDPKLLEVAASEFL
ncbi:MAG: hypothetical protein AYK23_02140 [Candidatus Proteinoplasmatales archaeon SG8-5]|nr:MAG: hypothetical protein AYK23_02140 [Candidatus Proteinoplasmatales archaeon SG8-5]